MASRRAKGFLAEYRLEDSYLLRPDRVTGRAGILRGRDPQSLDVLVKLWPRTKGADDSDLEDIWRSEIRQLQRLAAVPGADDLFVHMVSSGQDNDGFYVVLDPGQGSLLEILQRAPRRPEMLSQARQPRFRRILWGNARRLAEALELLHSQGAIHRNLDPWAVVTALDQESDFRMTGFEWSMRIASLDVRGRKRVRSAPRPEHEFSFARDWRDLALLFALFLDIPTGPLGDMKIIPSRVAEFTSAAEARLLRAMLGLERIERLDGEYVRNRIDEIVDGITAEVAGKDAKLCLAVRLGRDSRLAEEIRKATREEIEIADEEQQLKFIEDDLGRQVQLAAIRSGPDQVRYALVGRQLNYRLTPYRPPRSTEAGNWEFAYCDRAEMDAPPPAAIAGSALIDGNGVDVVRNVEAGQQFPRRRGRVQRWEDYFKRTQKTQLRKSDLDRMHESLVLLLILEMAYAVSDIFPVEVVSHDVDADTEAYVIRLMSRDDADRTKLSDLLSIDPPAMRLAKLLDADEVQEEGGWTLSEPGLLGERSSTVTSWRFVGREEIDNIEYLNRCQHDGTGYRLSRQAS